LELNIDETIFTIYFQIKGPDTLGYIYADTIEQHSLECKEDRILQSFNSQSSMLNVISYFFNQKLNFLPLEETRAEKYSVSLSQKTISWDVYGQALFISANNYTNYLFPHNKFLQHHQKTMSMYLGLDLVEAVSRLEVSRNKANMELTFEKKRVSVNAQGIKEKIEQLQDELQNVEERIGSFDVGESILVNPNYLEALREKTATCTAQLAALVETEQTLTRTRDEMQAEIHKLRRAQQELKEVIQFKFFLSGLVIEQCPHCEGAISQVSVEEELATHKCRVCHNDLKPLASTEDHQKLLNQTNNRIAEQEREIRKINKDINKVKAEYAESNQVAIKYRNELHDLSRQERVGLKDELQSLIGRQGYMKGQLEQLQKQTEESQSQRLQDLKTKYDILEVALGQLRREITVQHEHLLKHFQSKITSLAKSFGVPNLEYVWFDKNFNMLLKQSNCQLQFGDMDQSERLRIKIAFHLALLSLRMEGLGRHPALLIVDAPGNAEMDEHNFNEILQGFAQVKVDVSNEVQILIASTKDDLIDICGRNQVDYRKENETLF
jgi:hypothetical protein